MASLFPQEEKKKKNNIKAIQICYIKAAVAALLLGFGVFPQMWIHLDPPPRPSWSSSGLMRGSWWNKGSCRAARWVRCPQNFRGDRLGSAPGCV